MRCGEVTTAPLNAYIAQRLEARAKPATTNRELAALKKRGVICPWVFNQNGKRIKIIKHCRDTASRLAGCPGRIPHDLRRTAIRAMVRAGISEHTAMLMSGHKW